MNERNTPHERPPRRALPRALLRRGLWALLVLAVLALLSACRARDTVEEVERPETTPSPEISVPEALPEPVEPFIAIDTPPAGEQLDINDPLPVRGTAAGVGGETLVVQALDAQGGLLAESRAPVTGSVAGLTWSTELEVAAAPETPGRILVSGITAEDGAPLTAEIQVVFGIVIGPFITIEEPVSGDVLDASRPITVRGTGGSLFEGGLAVEARDGEGNLLAIEPTIVQSINAGIGGRGPWSVELILSLEESTPGTIYAFSTSPRDGSVIAEDTVVVTFDLGEESGEAPLLPLSEHLWILAAYEDEDALPEATVSAHFGPAGRVTGSGGCNSYTAEYEAGDEELSVGAVVSTRRFCDLPEGVMEQEAAFVNLLGQAASYRIEDEGLVISDGAGREVLRLAAAITGEVVSRQPDPLPDDARVIVQLLDMSSGARAVGLLGEAIIEAQGRQLPIPFTLTYSPGAVSDRLRYGLSVRVVDASGVLLFVSDSPTPALTQGNPRSDVQVQVTPVG
jgi:heat shock protein HslJ